MDMIRGNLLKKWVIDDYPVAVSIDVERSGIHKDRQYYFYIEGELTDQEIREVEEGGYEVSFEHLESVNGWHIFKMVIERGSESRYHKKYEEHALTAVSKLTQ